MNQIVMFNNLVKERFKNHCAEFFAAGPFLNLIKSLFNTLFYYFVGCGDKEMFCFMKDIFKPSQHCNGKYSEACPRSCNKCSGNENGKCANLKDRAQNCNQRNCRASDELERYRTHIKCTRTCCQKGQLY